MKSDEAQFQKLYKEYQPLVRSVIYQIAGSSHLDDLVQEAFIKIWKGLSGFQEQSQLSTWIYRVSTNVALDALRSWSRRREKFDYDFSGLQDERSGPEENFANQQIVQQGLQSLSEQHRTILVLAFIHERPMAEIADIVRVTEGTVKSRLHYAKDAFINFLNQKGVKL